MCCVAENNPFCSRCTLQRERLFDYIDSKDAVTLATLGPDGTTSSEAAKVFKKYLQDKNKSVELNVQFYDSFESALDEVHKKNVDLILVPNAYVKMNKFYWDTTIELNFYFTNKTPNYGIASIGNNSLLNKEILDISTCKAVEHLVSELWETTDYRSKNFRIVEASSTKKSLMLMEEGKVDLALTNDTSLISSNAFFISETKCTEVLWSIFMLRTIC